MGGKRTTAVVDRTAPRPEPACECDEVHVYPLYGPEHDMTLDCWCHPERCTEQPSVIIHNVAQ